MINSMYTTISGIEVSRKQIETSMNNIANESTPGYKKRHVQTEEIRQANVPQGRGVRISGMIRAVDASLNSRIYDANGKHGYIAEQKDLFEPVRDTLSQGLLGVDSFREVEESFEQLRNVPDNVTFREEVRSKVLLFATKANQTLSALDSANSKALQSAKDSVDDINEIVKKISYLNGAIASTGADVSLEMQDKRDMYEKKLSQYVKYTVSRDHDEYKLKLDGAADGEYLIYRTTHKELSIQEAEETRSFTNRLGENYSYTTKTAILKMHQPDANLNNGITIDLSNTKQGALNAQLGYLNPSFERDSNGVPTSTPVSNYKENDLETIKLMSMKFISNIRDDIASKPSAGSTPEYLKLFSIDFTKGTSDSNTEGNYITPSDSTELDKTDAQMVTSIVLDIFPKKTESLHNIKGDMDIEEQENFIGTYIDTVYANKEEIAYAEKSILDVYEKEYERVSMVDRTEEMIDVMKFQAAYQAGAKMVQVIDEMIQTMLGLKR